VPSYSNCHESTTAVADHTLRVQMTKLHLVLVAPTTQRVSVPSGASLVANSHPITSQYVESTPGPRPDAMWRPVDDFFLSTGHAAAMEGSWVRAWTRGASTNRLRACVGRFDWIASMSTNKRPFGRRSALGNGRLAMDHTPLTEFVSCPFLRQGLIVHQNYVLLLTIIF
jgi:hypothetical protein